MVFSKRSIFSGIVFSLLSSKIYCIEYNSNNKALLYFNRYSLNDLNDNSINTISAIIRPNLSLLETYESGTKLSLNINPRAEFNFTKFDKNSLNEKKYNSDFYFNEVYISFQHNEIKAQVGKIYIQWGPSEIITPSNTLTDFSLNQLNQNWEGLGNYSTQISITQKQEWLFQYIYEHNQYNFNQHVFRADFTSKDVPFYSGFTFSVGQNLEKSIGEYIQYEIKSGFSIYADSHQEIKDKNIKTLSVLGLKYENEIVYTFEYLDNENGIINTFQKSQKIFPSGTFYYGSVRSPFYSKWKDFQAIAFIFFSPKDYSSLLDTQFNVSMNDNLILFFEATKTFGKINSTIKKLLDTNYLLGITYAF